MDIDNLSKGFELTLQNYLDNPSNEKGTVMNLKMLRDGMRTKYDESAKNKKYDISVFEDTDKIYILVGVPSESYKMNYQVMIEMKYDDKSSYIDDLDIRIFSNCPSFVYTYAYVYNTRQLLIPELKNKYSKEVLSKPPVQRNFNKVISYEKSLFYAFSYLLEYYRSVSDLLKDSKKVKRYNPFDDVLSDVEIGELYTKKRKEYNDLKKKNIVVALADKLKKEKAKKAKTNKNIPDGKRSHVKSKVTGKPKLTGKSKTR